MFANIAQGIKARLKTAAEAPPPVLDPNTALLGVEEDDDDYEPDYYAAEDTEQILNKLDSTTSKEVMKAADSDFGVKPFRLPSPPELTTEMAEVYGNDAVERLLSYLKARSDGSKHNPKAGVNRLAARFNDRESWFTFASRLASRQENDPVPVKEEDGPVTSTALTISSRDYDQKAYVREILYKYVLEDFRRRIDAAVSWLSEEWYSEQRDRRAGRGGPSSAYEALALRLIDGMLPYLTPQDKLLTRFLSELPELTAAMLARVKSMCRDPSVVQLALTTLLYLVMMRPPIRGVALDTVQDIWTECEFFPSCSFLIFYISLYTEPLSLHPLRSRMS